MLLLIVTHTAQNFYSHASCEARQRSVWSIRTIQLFLLTRLLRGATCDGKTAGQFQEHFYSHASCEARHLLATDWEVLEPISTHTPLARRDDHGKSRADGFVQFLLTRLLRGATLVRPLRTNLLWISTHTPLARRDG